jgi:hypothetical protein
VGENKIVDANAYGGCKVIKFFKNGPIDGVPWIPMQIPPLLTPTYSDLDVGEKMEG